MFREQKCRELLAGNKDKGKMLARDTSAWNKLKGYNGKGNYCAGNTGKGKTLRRTVVERTTLN